MFNNKSLKYSMIVHTPVQKNNEQISIYKILHTVNIQATTYKIIITLV